MRLRIAILSLEHSLQRLVPKVPCVNVRDDVVNVRVDKTIYVPVPVVNVRDDVVKNGSEAYRYVVARRNEWL